MELHQYKQALSLPVLVEYLAKTYHTVEVIKERLDIVGYSIKNVSQIKSFFQSYCFKQLKNKFTIS